MSLEKLLACLMGQNSRNIEKKSGKGARRVWGATQPARQCYTNVSQRASVLSGVARCKRVSEKTYSGTPNLILDLHRESLPLISEKQKCTDLGGHHFASLFPPISWLGKTVDSYRIPCRNSRTSHRKDGFSGTGNWPMPLKEERGAKATQNDSHDLVHVCSP